VAKQLHTALWGLIVDAKARNRHPDGSIVTEEEEEAQRCAHQTAACCALLCLLCPAACCLLPAACCLLPAACCQARLVSDSRAACTHVYITHNVTEC
jgi:hypothetical protein